MYFPFNAQEKPLSSEPIENQSGVSHMGINGLLTKSF
jgi:hypothetical protein